MKLSLNCFVLGKASIFTANVPKKYTNDNFTEIEYSALTVSNFTEIISNQVKHAVPDPDDSNSMKLWQVDIDDENLKNISTEKDIENKFNGKEMKRAYLFSDYFPDGTVPTLRNIHIIIVPVTDTPNKRIKLKDLNLERVQTKTTEFLEDLLYHFDEPVSRENINRYLNAPLRKKLPAHYYYCLNYPTYLDYKEADYLPELCNAVDSVLDSFKEQVNQEMLTSDIVNNTIQKMFKVIEKFIAKCGFEWVRNNKIDDFITTTNKKRARPDVTVYYKNVLVMMGEEKDVSSKLQNAVKELDDHFSFWNTLAFGDLPLVIGFAACGTQIQFYYYHVTGLSKKPRREEIGDRLSLGTENKLNNLQALQYTINIIRIFRTFDYYNVIRTPLLKLFNVIHRDNGSTITIAPKKVIKSIKKESIKDENLHKKLHQETLPELGHYRNVEYKTTKNTIYLTFGPVGYLSIPENENDLRCAILNILKIVDKLHDKKVGVVHRDIRWGNVVKLTDDKWLLIDFEEAAKTGEERTALRIAAPEYGNNDICQASGDIWMIGKLMDDFRIKFILSERARNFRDRLMSEDPKKRPTATVALNDDWFKEMESDNSME